MAGNVHILTFFAESIREEKSGQKSLIGIFDDELQGDGFPMMIPQLALLITITTHLDDPFVLASFRVFMEDGDTLIAEELSNDVRESQHKAIAEIVQNDPDREWISMRITVAINALKVERKSALSVEASDINGLIATSNKLKFTQKPTPPTQSLSI